MTHLKRPAHRPAPSAAGLTLSTRLARAALGLCCAVGVPACSGDDVSYTPYAGTPYPNRRPSFENDGRLLGYVANRLSDSVSVVDLDAMTLLGNAPAGRDPVDIDGPRHVTLDERAGLAYVTLSYPNDEVGAHAAETGATERPSYVLSLDLTDLRPMGEQRVAPNAEDAAFFPDRDELVVAHNDTLRSLREVDLDARRANIDFVSPASGMAARTTRVRPLKVCVAPTNVLYSADGARAYVACTGEDQIAVVDTTNATVLTRVPAGEGVANQPYAMTADATGERLAVSNRVARSVAIFTMTDEPELLSVVYLQGVPYFAGWLPDNRLLVPTQDYNGVAAIDASAQPVIEREVSYPYETCEKPTEVVAAPDGRVFLVCEGTHYSPGAIVRVDPTTLEVLERVEVGIYPDRLALRPARP